ncbi:hypothetical protein ABPG74_017117 [Tetrahymena malaccensis]
MNLNKGKVKQQILSVKQAISVSYQRKKDILAQQEKYPNKYKNKLSDPKKRQSKHSERELCQSILVIYLSIYQGSLSNLARVKLLKIVLTKLLQDLQTNQHFKQQYFQALLQIILLKCSNAFIQT